MATPQKFKHCACCQYGQEERVERYGKRWMLRFNGYVVRMTPDRRLLTVGEEGYGHHAVALFRDPTAAKKAAHVNGLDMTKVEACPFERGWKAYEVF